MSMPRRRKKRSLIDDICTGTHGVHSRLISLLETFALYSDDAQTSGLQLLEVCLFVLVAEPLQQHVHFVVV